MNKKQFLDELRLELSKAHFDKTDEAVKFFEEMLLDRAEEEKITEDEAAQMMPNPKEAARQILSDENVAQRSFFCKDADRADDLEKAVRITKTVKTDGIYKIGVLTSNTGINVQTYSGEDIKISYTEYPDEDIQYDFSVENGEIILRKNRQRSSFYKFLSFRGSSPVEVLVPREITAKCSFETSNAKIEVDGLKVWGEIKTKTSNASTTVKSIEASHIDIKTSNGKIKAKELKIYGNACCKSSNASIDLSGIDCLELYANTSNGKIKAENIKADEKFKLSTSNGSIEIDNIKSAYIDLATSQGSIKGRIEGSMKEYSIMSSTSLGKSNLPVRKNDGDKKLKAATSMGNINIDFS